MSRNSVQKGPIPQASSVVAPAPPTLPPIILNDPDTQKDGKSKKLKVSAKLKRAIDILVTDGCTITTAANAVGLTRENLRRALHKDHVAQELDRTVRKYLSMNGAKAAYRLVHLTANAKSEYVQLEAAKDVLDRAGIGKTDDGARGQELNVQINLGSER